jgi:hypothetical protein
VAEALRSLTAEKLKEALQADSITKPIEFDE